MKTEQAHNTEQWKKMRFDQFFDMLPTNTLSRDKLNNQRGEYQNIHYGDVLIKYPYCLDCNVNDIPYINEGVRFNTAQVKNGDVIFADTAEDDTVGKCVEVLNVGDRKIVSGLHTYFCRPKHEMAHGYLGYFLNSNHFHNQLLPYIAGSKVSSVNRTSIARTFIFYPESLPAQRRIAAILSSADKVIDTTQRLIEKYKKMKQGMMEDLLKPKEGWKKYEYKDVIIENRLGGNYENSTANIGYPVIKMGNIMRGYISLEKVQYLSFEKRYIADDVLKKGDLLFNTRNTLDLVGKVSIWNNELPFALYNSNLLRMKFDENIIGSNEFMNYYFNYHKTLMELRGFAIGTTSVAAIYGRDLDRLSIIVPSIKEQRRIAAILSGIDAKIAAEEKVLEKYEKVKKGLMERLLEGENNLN